MDIRINNSNLVLTNRTYLEPGEKCRYKESYVIGERSIWTVCRPIDWSNAHYKILTTKNTYSGVEYSQEELTMLKNMLITMSRKRNLDVAEVLCRAIDSPRISLAFQKLLFEPNSIEHFKEFITKCWSNEPEIVSIIKTEVCRQYKPGNRYNILDLSKDLVRYKCKILTDPEMIEKYIRISAKTKYVSSPEYSDPWGKIIKTKMHSERANLNLQYSLPVSVRIPENTEGVPEGYWTGKTIKSMCLVCDGEVWTKEIIIQCSDKTFLKKLKSVPGLVKFSLLYCDELVLDLTKIPIVKRSGLRHITNYALGRAEYIRYKSSLGEVYRRIMSDRKKEEKSKEELFLESLGICGDLYYPEISEEVTERIYEASYIRTELLNIKHSATRQRVEKFIKGGTTGSKVMDNILEEIKSSEKTELEWREEKLKAQERIGELKFRLLMRKHLFFDQPGNHNISETYIFNGLEMRWVVQTGTVSA